MSTNKRAQLLDDLQSLLERQIELTQRGNPAGGQSAALSRQADSLVAKIAQAGILELAEFKTRREQLRKLYEDLCLAVTAQKAETGEKLSTVRKTRKTIETYRNNL